MTTRSPRHIVYLEALIATIVGSYSPELADRVERLIAIEDTELRRTVHAATIPIDFLDVAAAPVPAFSDEGLVVVEQPRRFVFEDGSAEQTRPVMGPTPVVPVEPPERRNAEEGTRRANLGHFFHIDGTCFDEGCAATLHRAAAPVHRGTHAWNPDTGRCRKDGCTAYIGSPSQDVTGIPRVMIEAMAAAAEADANDHDDLGSDIAPVLREAGRIPEPPADPIYCSMPGCFEHVDRSSRKCPAGHVAPAGTLLQRPTPTGVLPSIMRRELAKGHAEPAAAELEAEDDETGEDATE